MAAASTLLIKIAAAMINDKEFVRLTTRGHICVGRGSEVKPRVTWWGLSPYAGCKTHYKMVRRNIRYSQPDHAEKAPAIKESARCRSRRKRLLEVRQSVLEAEELAFWKVTSV